MISFSNEQILVMIILAIITVGIGPHLLAIVFILHGILKDYESLIVKIFWSVMILLVLLIYVVFLLLLPYALFGAESLWGLAIGILFLTITYLRNWIYTLRR